MAAKRDCFRIVSQAGSPFPFHPPCPSGPSSGPSAGPFHGVHALIGRGSSLSADLPLPLPCAAGGAAPCRERCRGAALQCPALWRRPAAASIWPSRCQSAARSFRSSMSLAPSCRVSPVSCQPASARVSSRQPGPSLGRQRDKARPDKIAHVDRKAAYFVLKIKGGANGRVAEAAAILKLDRRMAGERQGLRRRGEAGLLLWPAALGPSPLRFGSTVTHAGGKK